MNVLFVAPQPRSRVPFHLRNRVRQQLDLIFVQCHVFTFVVFHHDDVRVDIFVAVPRPGIHQHVDIVSHFIVCQMRHLVKLGIAQISRGFTISNISISQSYFQSLLSSKVVAFEISFARCLNCKLIVSTDSISSTSTNSFGLNALSLNNIINDVRFCMNPTLVTLAPADSKSNNGIFSLNGCVCIPLPTAAGNNAFNKPSSSFSFPASKQTYDVVHYISPIPLVFGDNALHLIGPFVTFSDGASSKSSHAPPSSMDAFASSAESFARVFHPRTTAWTFFKIQSFVVQLPRRRSASRHRRARNTLCRSRHPHQTPFDPSLCPTMRVLERRFLFSSSSPPRGVFFDTTTTSSSFGIVEIAIIDGVANRWHRRRNALLDDTTTTTTTNSAFVASSSSSSRRRSRGLLLLFVVAHDDDDESIDNCFFNERMCPLCLIIMAGLWSHTKRKIFFAEF